MNPIKLDNPAWYSLVEIHRHLAVNYNGIKFYHPDYCPFGGFLKNSKTSEAISAYSTLTNNCFVVGDKPDFDHTVILKKELICDQMVLQSPIDLHITETITALKTDQQKSDLFNLVQLVQPGYFKTKTSDLGNYYGIYKDEQLIATTGERMKMYEYTEVSAVVTHPQHLGKGYAKQLIKHATDAIFAEGKTPYLHVAETNHHAIKLYEKLNFITRRKMSLWNFVPAY